MMRLPPIQYHAPASLREAAELLAKAPDSTALVAGGTHLLPNMKRRQHAPATLIALRRVAELKGIREKEADGLDIGAGTTLGMLVRDPRVRQRYGALWQAAAQVATPLLRNMGTLGGNLCLDTRCNYYDQSYEWRKAIGFCMKKDGGVCWVAPSSSCCLAVSSTDTAPALVALGATVSLVGVDHVRRLRVSDLYRKDGIHYLTKQPTEILSRVHVGSADGWRSTYWKLRRRGSFDFPVLSVAAAVRFGPDAIIHEARIVLGAVSSCPIEVPAAATALVGTRLDDEAIAEAAGTGSAPARPLDNTDFSLHWRKRMTRELITYALRELRGDDVRELRRRIARVELVAGL